jgi:hypothetical protein
VLLLLLLLLLLLPQVTDMCIRYAEMERKLGEIDRARAIFVYAAQLCDPKVRKTERGREALAERKREREGRSFVVVARMRIVMQVGAHFACSHSQWTPFVRVIRTLEREMEAASKRGGLRERRQARLGSS